MKLQAKWILALAVFGVMLSDATRASDARKVSCGFKEVECQLTVSEPHRAGVFRFLEKWQAKKRAAPKNLKHKTVLFVNAGGDYVYSTVRHFSDMAIAQKVRYVHASGKKWFELYVEAPDVEDNEEKWMERGRAVIEPVLRNYLIKKGYRPVSKLDFGIIRKLEIGVQDKYLLLQFCFQGTLYKVRLAQAKKAEKSGCTGGKITKVKSSADWVVVQFEEPVAKFEGEGVSCAREAAVLKIILGQGKPHVMFGGNVLQPES